MRWIAVLCCTVSAWGTTITTSAYCGGQATGGQCSVVSASGRVDVNVNAWVTYQDNLMRGLAAAEVSFWGAYPAVDGSTYGYGAFNAIFTTDGPERPGVAKVTVRSDRFPTGQSYLEMQLAGVGAQPQTCRSVNYEICTTEYLWGVTLGATGSIKGSVLAGAGYRPETGEQYLHSTSYAAYYVRMYESDGITPVRVFDADTAMASSAATAIAHAPEPSSIALVLFPTVWFFLKRHWMASSLR
jgi:hypothetical protein